MAMSNENMRRLAQTARELVEYYRTHGRSIRESTDLGRVQGAVLTIEQQLGHFAGADLSKYDLQKLRATLGGFKGTFLERKRALSRRS